MNLSSKKYKNDTIAPKLVQKSLRNISRFLIFVGKPFYLSISYSFLVITATAIITFHLLQYLAKSPEKSVQIISRVSQAIFEMIELFFEFLFYILFKIISLLTITIFKIISTLVRFLLRFPTKYTITTSHLKRFFISLIKFEKPIFSKSFLVFMASLIFTLSTLATIFWQLVLKDLPKPSELTERSVEVSTKIYDRNGILLYKIYKDQNRTLVVLDDIPKHVQLATLAIEDAEFYSHPGFSIKGIARAIVKNIKKGELAGGSTITQQLVKNALLTSEKTLVRKLKELTLAVLVELTYSKNEILEMYLNEVSYGGTAYGIQEAAGTYFDKNVGQLTLAEAALLAGLPKSPTKYSPFGPNPDSARQRQKEVLHLMQINKYISEEQRQDAENQNLEFAENKIDIKAPHFVMYVRQALEEKYSKELVEKGGLKVTTTLDYKIQKLVEKVVKEEVESLKKLNVGNGAVVVLNPKSGEILAMVGSKDYFDTVNDGNVNVTTRPRQPGSSIKIINYAYALSNGYTPATLIEDSAVTFLVDGQPPYTPKNYEGGFRGKLTLRSAFAESRNIPAVKVLASYGVEEMFEQGAKMGITTWKNPSDYGLSLTLGGGDVKLIDLATSYATIANYGKKPKLSSVLKIRNYNNEVFKKNEHEAEQVLDPRVAFVLTDILKDNIARSPAFGTNSLLNISGHEEVAVKTGTSNNLRDNLAIGYNQNYVVAVWVGNNDNSQMSRIASGVTGATPIFNKIMSALLKDMENRDWEIPEGLIQLPICSYTGTLACTGCPIKTEWFLEENTPEKACSPEWFRNEKVEQVGQVDQVGQGEGKILEEAARMEVVDLREGER